MQQTHGRAVAEERSRRRPPRGRSPATIPIPEGRPSKATTAVRLQDALAAHQQAIDERLEQGVRDLQRVAVEIVRRAVAEASVKAPQPTGGVAGALAQGEALSSILAHAEERFQAITLRLQRVEGAIRQLAKAQRETAPADPNAIEVLTKRIGVLATGVSEGLAEQRLAIRRLAAAQHQALVRLASEQRRVADRLEVLHRETLADLAERTGRGVVAVARRLQRDLERKIDETATELRPGDPPWPSPRPRS